MKSLKSKSDRKALKEAFEKIVKETPVPSFRILSLSQMMKLAWWDIFNEKRTIYFAQLIVNGYNARSAFNEVNGRSDSEVLSSLSIHGWK